MSLSVEIEVSDQLTPYLARVHAKLTDRTDLHAYMAPHLEALTKEHLNDISRTGFRHRTATRLGAKQSGHLLRAASAIESGHDGESAWLTFPRITGLSRAFRAYHITTPTASGKKWLAIPAIASAYNRRPREFSDLKFIPFGGKHAGNLAALVKRTQSERKFMVVYWLKKEVRIPQDRTLLPSDQDYTEIAEAVTGEYILNLDENA